jgi:hypothetical protein
VAAEVCRMCLCVLLCVCVCVYVCVYFFFLFLSMLHYFGGILHAVIYMLVSLAGDVMTRIMASVSAFSLQL